MSHEAVTNPPTTHSLATVEKHFTLSHHASTPKVGGLTTA